GEESSVNIRNDKATQFFFKNNLAKIKPLSISLPYKSKIFEVFNKDSSEEEDDKKHTLKIYKD
ncbi:4798_t:CDS:1, partial [Dentiscutata heterogama]